MVLNEAKRDVKNKLDRIVLEKFKYDYFNLFPILCLIVDNNKHVKMVNKNWTLEFGWFEEEILSNGIYHYVGKDDEIELKNFFDDIVNNKERLPLKTKFKTIDEQYKTIVWLPNYTIKDKFILMCAYTANI